MDNFGFNSKTDLIENLIEIFPDELRPLYLAHLEDMDGELLHYVLLGQIVSWMASQVNSAPETCERILSFLDDSLAHSSDEVKNLILVGGLDNLPLESHEGGQLRLLLGPRLRSKVYLR